MSCHGPSYRKVFLEWKATVTDRTAAVERQYAQTVAAIPGPMPAPLQDARFNLDLVTRGHGIHNVDYAYALLRRSHDDLNAARAERRLAPLPSPWAEIPYKSPCLACHQGIEGQQGRIFDREFQHRPHVMKAKLECSACHRTHEEREKGEVVRYDASGCVSCHHADTRGGVGCLGCHAGIRQKTVKVPRGDFSHAFHLDEAGQTCVDCHEVSPGKEPRLKEETCAGCHG
jgi:hypothetical protein